MSVVAQRANASGALAALAGDLSDPHQVVRTAGAAAPVLATPAVVLAVVAVTLATSSCDSSEIEIQ